MGSRDRMGIQPHPPQVGVIERFVTESGSVYTVDHDEKTMTRLPGPEAGEVAHDNEPFRYASIKIDEQTGCLWAIWCDSFGNPKLRQTTRVVSSERVVE